MATQQPTQTRLAYGAAEAASLLGVSRELLYALIRRGKLRSVRLGDRVLIPANEIRRVSGVDTNVSVE